MSEIAPDWDKNAPVALGTIHKVELSQRHGKRRSVKIYIERDSRTYRIKAVDHSRQNKITTTSMGIKCPPEVNSASDALLHFKNYPEKWLRFEGICQRMEDEDYWPGSFNSEHKQQLGAKSFPFKTMGHALRWYCRIDNGQSQGQLKQFGMDCWRLMNMEVDGGSFGQVEAQDINPQMMRSLTARWMDETQSM